MTINTKSPATFTTSILIGDPAFTNNAGHDSIPLMTTVGGAPVSAALEIQSTDSALLHPRMTTVQMNAIAVPTNGMVVYNTTANSLYLYTAGAWSPIDTSGGDVVGPGVSIAGDIAVFADTTGKVISDSGVNIGEIGVLLQEKMLSATPFRESMIMVAPPAGIQISNLTYLQFNASEGVGVFFVGDLMPLEFINNDFGPSNQICSLFTGDLPSSSTSPSALVELQSTTGAFLLSRMTTAQQNALLVPSGSAGMLLYNTDTGTFNGYNGSWVQLATGTGITWVDQTTTSVTMAVNTNYVSDNAGLVTLTLPTTCAFGSRFTITGKGSGGWKLAQNAGQQIHFGNTATTSGATGFLASTNQYDSVTLVCVTANTTFVVYSSIGNMTVN